METLALTHIIVFLAGLYLVQWSNHFCIRRLNAEAALERQPYVSILVPARNEEDNIRDCVSSLLKQEYANFEIIVLDDHSDDATAAILRELQSEFPQLRVLQGRALPSGWYGKHWACQQLGEAARGELLLFTDADTRHQPQMLRAAAAAQAADDSDLMSAFVRQRMNTLGELLAVSFPFWSVFSLLPMIIGVRFRSPAFTAANGQFMLFTRSAYQRLGGHASVKNHAVDDVALARRILSLGMRWRMHDATGVVECRMYQNWRQAFAGFTKNYFAILDYRILLSIFVWTWLLWITWMPLTNGLVRLAGGQLLTVPGILSVTAILLYAGLWLLPCRRFGIPGAAVVLSHVIMAAAAVIGITSMIVTLSSKASWKGRTLEPPKIRWL